VKPRQRFLRQPKDFWASVRTISQAVGYSERGRGRVKVPGVSEIKKALLERGLRSDYIVTARDKLTDRGKTLLAYFSYRAKILNEFVEPRLMVDAHYTWWDCGRSYLCRIVDMLHMGYVDEVLFGREVVDRLPVLVKKWVALLRQRA